MPVGSGSAGPSFGRHAVDQTPYTDTADRIYAECLVTIDALLILQSVTGCYKTGVVPLDKPYVTYLLSSSALDL